MSEVTALLERSWERIEDPKNWIQGSAAADSEGRAIAFSNPMACRFCAIGSLFAEKVLDDVRGAARKFLSEAAQEEFKLALPAEVNDKCGHNAVRKMYALAIAKSKAAA